VRYGKVGARYTPTRTSLHHKALKDNAGDSLNTTAASHICAQVSGAQDVRDFAGHQQRLELGRQVGGPVRQMQVAYAQHKHHGRCFKAVPKIFAQAHGARCGSARGAGKVVKRAAGPGSGREAVAAGCQTRGSRLAGTHQFTMT
jgi:hypothetical protein